MKTSVAIKKAGGRRKLRELFGVSRQAVHEWIVRGTLPELRALQFEARLAKWGKNHEAN